MNKIQLPEFELPDLSQVSWQEVHDAVREYGKRCVELDRASRAAVPVGEVRMQDGCIVSTTVKSPLPDGGYNIVPQGASRPPLLRRC